MTFMCALASNFNCSILLAVPPYSKAPQLLGSMPSYWFSRVAATAGPHPLFSPSFHCLAHVTGWTPPLALAYSVLSITFPSGACQPSWEGAPGVGFLDVRAFDLSEEYESGLCSRLLLTRGFCYACLCPAAGRAHRTLAPRILSDVTHLNS